MNTGDLGFRRYAQVAKRSFLPDPNDVALQTGDRVEVVAPPLVCTLIGAIGSRSWDEQPIETSGGYVLAQIAEGVLDGAGSLVVFTDTLGTDRYFLSWQLEPVPPTGNLYVSAVVVGVSFTITSTGGAADVPGKVAALRYELVP